MKNLELKVKGKVIDIFFQTAFFQKLIRGKLTNTIIMYHGVTSVEKNDFNSRHIGIKAFKSQLLFFKKHCNIITLSEFQNKKFNPSKINIAITFDDGYLNNYTIAKPILEDLQIPATFFVTGLNATNDEILWADFLDIASKKYFNPISIENEVFTNKNGIYVSTESQEALSSIIKYKKADYSFKLKMKEAFSELNGLFEKEKDFEFWKLMSNEQISDCRNSKFIEIGSHGYYHNNLGTIQLEKAKEEVHLSKKYLENILQKDVISIGFPDGSYSRELISYCESIGFLNQVAAEGYLFPDDKTDERIKDRKGIYNFSSPNNQLYNALTL